MNQIPQLAPLPNLGFDGRSRQRLLARELNKFFRALSDETRRNILRVLAQGEYSVGEIVGYFDLSQPTISRHLSVLREADLVIDQRRGQNVIYRLNAQAISESAHRFFESLRNGKLSHG